MLRRTHVPPTRPVPHREALHSLGVELTRELDLGRLLEPLVYRGRLVGVIVLDSEDESRKFTETDRQILALFAAHAAVALENARLYAELKRAYEELVRSEKLRAVGQLGTGMAHDLNNVLAVIPGQVEPLKLHTGSAEILEGLHTLETAAADGAEVVRWLQDFARLRGGAPCSPWSWRERSGNPWRSRGPAGRTSRSAAASGSRCGSGPSSPSSPPRARRGRGSGCRWSTGSWSGTGADRRGVGAGPRERHPVELPDRPAGAGPAAARRRMVAPKRLLPIDDDSTLRRTLARLQEETPDIVFTDLGMPEMTGWEVARAVKAGAPALPVVLLTGGDQATSEPEGEGCVDRVLGKPVRLEDLLATIAELTAPPPL